MPIAFHKGTDTRQVVHGCDFPFWTGVSDGWLRAQGRTRVLIIDDQLTKRQDLFAVESEDAPLCDAERELSDWLNVDVQFLRPPLDYRYGAGDLIPRGHFNSAWFERSLDEALGDPKPVAAILLDLLFGNEKRVQDASGPKFLSLLRRRLPHVPVLILSNVEESSEVRGLVKEGGASSEGDVSFQDYLAKSIPGGPGLTDRLVEKLIEWGDLSDPGLCAFSPAMRRLSRQMRRIVMLREVTAYQEQNAMFPRPVVIRGDIGTGKNYIAGKLQSTSDRSSAPYLTIDFSQFEAENFTASVFGSGSFTGATQRYRVRAEDAAVLAGPNAPDHNQGLYLSSIGIFHRVHIAGQRPGPDQRPLRGTLLLDEIGIAPQEMQTRLLRIFNCGRFTPHLGTVEVPTQGALDIWYLITLSPEGQGRLRDDLRTRIGVGWWIDVPELKDRKEDVLPLALTMLRAAPTDIPETFFSREALTELSSLSERIQVRDLRNLLEGFSGITSKPPYSGADLRESARQLMIGDTPAPRVHLNGATPHAAADNVGGCDTSTGYVTGTPSTSDSLQILSQWRSAGEVLFPSGPRSQSVLRGKGRAVAGGAAVAVLSFLELCAEAQCLNGRYSSTRTWNFFAGVSGTKAPEARTRIAPFFLIDEAASMSMLRQYDALLWLALDVSPRRTEVRGLIERLRTEEAQAERIARLRCTFEEPTQ